MRQVLVLWPTIMWKTFGILVLASVIWRCIRGQGSTSDLRGNTDSITSLSQHLEAERLSFTLKLAELLVNEFPNQNVIFSPVTVYRSLAIIYQGATDKTADEFSAVLGLPYNLTEQSKNDVHEILGNISRILQSKPRNFDIVLANGLFTQEGMFLKKQFREQILRNSDMEIQTVDFSSPQRSGSYMNEWVLDKTRGHTSRLYYLNGPPSDTALVSLNAFYFHAIWADGFNAQWTKKAKFTVKPGEVPIVVDMMHNIKKVHYYQSTTEGYTAIGLPYVDRNFIMYFILPNDDHRSLATLVRRLRPAELESMTRQSQQTHCWVDYKIPRVKFSWRKNLIPELESLGIRSAFNVDSSSFKNMYETENVYIASFGHGTNIEIDEDGVVAISPGLMLLSKGEGPCGDEPYDFVLNRPFLVILHHRITNTILSYGAVYNPYIVERRWANEYAMKVTGNALYDGQMLLGPRNYLMDLKNFCPSLLQTNLFWIDIHNFQCLQAIPPIFASRSTSLYLEMTRAFLDMRLLSGLSTGF